MTNFKVLCPEIKNSKTIICLAFYYLTFKIIKIQKIKTREEIGLQGQKWLNWRFSETLKISDEIVKNKN